ncbi:MAG: insulinase family protein, partial [Verrucomicrobiae bacterium]|nr:insulinase family protein [Verrucomicrobiae bacterium]
DHDDPVAQPVTLSETKRVYHEDNFARSPRLTMAFPTVDFKHEDGASLELLAQLLGDGKKAPLYKVLVEEKKLAPGVSSYNQAQEIAGVFEVTVTGFPTTNLTDVESAVQEAFARFESEGFSEADLERLKAKYETSFYNGISSVFFKSYQLAFYNEYFGSPDALARELQKVLDVTSDDIKRVYQQYLKDRPYVVTSFVPKGKVDLVVKGSDLYPVVEEAIVEQVEKTAKGDDIEVAKIPSSFDRSVDPEDGPQPEVNLPEIWKEDLGKGVTLYGSLHDELPLINFSITIDGGMLLEDPDKIGIVNLVAQMMTEGTANKTPVELEEAIDSLGSSIRVNASKEDIQIVANTLKRNFKPTLELVEEILFEPRWDAKEFERVKRETVEGIQRRSAEPSAISRTVFDKLVYGDHILGNALSGTVDSVEAIGLDDLKSYVDTNFSPGLATISIVGDIRHSEATQAFAGLVKRWEEKQVTFPEYALPKASKKARVYFVDVPDAKQSEIRIGYLAMPRTDPDFYACTVMNTQLGGNFSGDVNMVLREEKGYTYGARTGFSGSRFPGTFVASSAVRSNATEDSVKIFKDLMTAYREPIEEADLEFTKNVTLKSNARRFETLNAIRGMIETIATYGLPFDYIRDEEEVVRKMTVESHNALARKYIRPDAMIYLVVGDAATQLDGLKSLGYGDPVLLDKDGDFVE